jgi:hypothetical protein
MFRSLGDLIGASMIATDGEIGRICNFLFDDQSWNIRYSVVDVGRWLTRREVVISVSAIDQPDWKTKTLRARLTKEQLRDGPDVDSKKPVSRQQEIAMREYFGWPAYWDTIVDKVFPPSLIPAGREFPVHTGEDNHLRSWEDVIGYEVWASDGVVGCLESFVVDDAVWHIGYLDVKTGEGLQSRSVLVPTSWVKSISWADHHVNLQGSRERI